MWVKPATGTAGAVNVDLAKGNMPPDTRTPEQKDQALEEAIASIFSLTLAAMVAGPLIWYGLIAWWIAVGLGVAVYFGMNKVFCGPLRIVSVLARMFFNAVMWSIAIGTAMAALGAFLFICFKLVAQNG